MIKKIFLKHIFPISILALFILIDVNCGKPDYKLISFYNKEIPFSEGLKVQFNKKIVGEVCEIKSKNNRIMVVLSIRNQFKIPSNSYLLADYKPSLRIIPSKSSNICKDGDTLIVIGEEHLNPEYDFDVDSLKMMDSIFKKMKLKK